VKKKETPIYAKIAAWITIAYALSPIDLIPDFIPLLGYMDDLILLPMMIAITVRLIPKDIFAECEEQAKNLLNNGKQKKWYYALPIIIIWLIVICLVVWSILRNINK
jgi:uncharacterized membrane protein YkvA (DUF1232 family)